MKDQYVGDIGDYGKYALLRALACRYSIGINWYLTCGDDKADGRFTRYLLKDNDDLDDVLFRKMKHLLYPDGETLHHESRCVSNIENGNYIPNAMFFNEELIFDGKTDRKTHRKDWVNQSLDKIVDRDIIFLDPDNGLEVKAVPPTRKNGNKYVTYDEALLYYKHANVALIVYNHRDRSPKELYLKRFLRFYEYETTQDAFVYRLTFHKASVRDYIFITKPEYSKEINDFLNKFVCPQRDAYFRIGELPMK
jgi:hypothetical protein